MNANSVMRVRMNMRELKAIETVLREAEHGWNECPFCHSDIGHGAEHKIYCDWAIAIGGIRQSVADGVWERTS